MALTKKYNIWNVNFICVFIVNFIISFVFYMSTGSSNDFATRILGASDSMAGMASGIFVIGALFSRLYFGSIIDSINVKKTIFLSLVFFLISNVFYFFVHDIWFLIFTRLFSGVFYGICSCGAGAAVARLIPSNKKGIGIGYYAVSIILSSAFGPALAIKFSSANDFNLCFAISCASVFVGIIASYILKVRRFKKHHHKANTNHRFSFYNYFEKSTSGIASVAFLLGFAYCAILVYIGAYVSVLDSMGGGEYIFSYTFAGSLFFVVYASVSVFSRPFAGKVFDTKGPNFVIIPSIIFLAIALILLSWAIHPMVIFVSAVFCAIGYGSASSSLQSLALKICPPNKAGLANSSYFIALDLGVGVSPYLLGIIKPMIGVKSIFEVCALLIILSLGFYYVFVARKLSK